MIMTIIIDYYGILLDIFKGFKIIRYIILLPPQILLNNWKLSNQTSSYSTTPPHPPKNKERELLCPKIRGKKQAFIDIQKF